HLDTAGAIPRHQHGGGWNGLGDGGGRVRRNGFWRHGLGLSSLAPAGILHRWRYGRQYAANAPDTQHGPPRAQETKDSPVLNPLFDIARARDAIAAGALVLTPNLRLARKIRDAWDGDCLAR